MPFTCAYSPSVVLANNLVYCDACVCVFVHGIRVVMKRLEDDS